MPERPDGGYTLDDDPPNPYLDPLTDEDRARLRRDGLSDEEIARLEAVLEERRSGNLRT